MEIIEQHTIPMAEVKEILDRITEEYNKESKELYYVQGKALNHAHKFTKLSLKDAKEMQEKLNELNINLEESQVVKICDMLPEDADDVRAILAKERFKYSQEELNRIIDTVAKYR